MLSIREEQMGEHFTKYHLDGIPFTAVLHHIKEADEGLPHDHPFGFTSYIIKGNYAEEIYDEIGRIRLEIRLEGTINRVKATTIHRIVRVSEGGVWTLIVPGPWERHCGFWDFSKKPAQFLNAPPPPQS